MSIGLGELVVIGAICALNVVPLFVIVVVSRLKRAQREARRRDRRARSSK